MKKIMLIMLMLICAASVYAEGPVIDGGFAGTEMLAAEGSALVYGVLVQIDPIDFPVSFYAGAGLNDLYIKGGVVYNLFDVIAVPISVYGGAGVGLDIVSSPYMGSEFLSGVELGGIVEAGILLPFSEYARLRAGYTYHKGDHVVSIGILIGYSKLGIGRLNRE